MAANIAVQRPPWEMQGVMREELSAIISNRSAAYLETGDYVAALVDAENVIQLKRNWSKGHFRKAKALVAMSRLQEAMTAIELGLAFEPTNPVSRGNFDSNTPNRLVSQEMSAFRSEIDAKIKAAAEAKAAARAKKT